MKSSFTTIDREFTPSEVSKITGVSVDLQRDWRRRGILPENASGKWTRFRLLDVVAMLVMKTFADAGYAVSYVAEFADLAKLPTLSFIYDLPGAVVFEGDQVSDRLKELHTRSAVVGARGRYLAMTTDHHSGQPATGRFEHLDDLGEFLALHGSAHCTILDCVNLVDIIANRAGLPLIRVEVETESPTVSPS